jgi:flagellar motor component MotA
MGRVAAMRVSGVVGIACASALIVIAAFMSEIGAGWFWSTASATFCIGLTLAIGVASFGVDDLLRAVAALRCLVIKPGAVSQRDVQVVRGLITPLYASGMIGTLIGLVQMLASLKDPSQIGAGMAIAMLTILYSVLGAELILRPAARLMADLAEAPSSSPEGSDQP